MKWKVITAVAASIALFVVVALTVVSRTARMPKTLGVRDGRLAPCPDSPNCVSTQSVREAQRMEPISLATNATSAITWLKTVLSEMPRARIVTADDRYLHAEFTSLLFRFVDDVEFLIDSDNGIIHFRSASRAGHSDFGVNRKRMEAIVSAFRREASHHERGLKTDR